MNKQWLMEYKYNGKMFIGGSYDTKGEANASAFLSQMNGNPAHVIRNPNYKE